MPLFSRASSAESSHPSEIGKSFSEAFLDSSSVRDTLPEQYRAHFDELRESILAFCREFKIPVETLRSKEAFGGELTSKKIPPERMAQAVSLFARLEHLVTNREPLKEKENSIEYVDRLYRLKEQYTSQVSLLECIGILKDGAITGIDGHDYPIPTLEQIATRLFEREKELSTKRDQGFTKLLLVPFGMSLDTLRETLEQFLLSYKQSHPDFDLNPDFPLSWEECYEGADTGDPPKMVYNPQFFDQDNHQGQTKRQILEAQADNPEDSFLGWRIHLFQPSNPTDPYSKGFAFIPRKNEGNSYGAENPRRDLEANQSPDEYLSVFQKAQDDEDSPYHSESGLTPEDWILVFMIHLMETGQPLDNYQNGTESTAYLIKVFFPSIRSSVFVSCACWGRFHRQADLEIYVPGFCTENIGVRSSVMI